jgi:hypothetical protein
VRVVWVWVCPPRVRARGRGAFDSAVPVRTD